MKVKFIGKKVTLKDHFKGLATKKLSRFDRIFDEDAEATIVVTIERNRQTVEISIVQRGMIYRAEAVDQEMNDALDDVIAALTTQIRRNRRKLQKAKRVHEDADLGFFTEELPMEEEDEDEEEDVRIARTKQFFVSVMTPEEAILQMNMLNHSFFMFREDSTGEINVVYRRKDGDYGLLIPER